MNEIKLKRQCVPCTGHTSNDSHPHVPSDCPVGRTVKKENIFIIVESSVGHCSSEQPRGPFKISDCHPILCLKCLLAPRACRAKSLQRPQCRQDLASASLSNVISSRTFPADVLQPRPFSLFLGYSSFGPASGPLHRLFPRLL